MRFYNLVVAVFFSIGLLSGGCRSDRQKIEKPPVDGTYFSIKQFFQDQYETYRNQPFVFLKVVTDGTNRDSGFVAADTMAWAPVLDAFFRADISDSAMVGLYKYSEFDESVTGHHMLLYEAKEPELITRQFMIGVDPFTGKILSIFMDVILPNGKNQKLYYAPLKMIQIQTFSGTGSKARNLRVEYRFPQVDNEAADNFQP